MLVIDSVFISFFDCYLLIDWADLISFPPLKPISKNDWAEENGIEIDDTQFVLNKREIELSFLLKSKSKLSNFLHFLTEKSVREYHFTEIDKRFSLRFFSVSSYQENTDRIEVKIKFIEDKPNISSDFQPNNTKTIHDDWKINEIPFFNFGIRILKGSEQIYKKGDTKALLEIQNANTQGVTTLQQSLLWKSQNATIKLFLCLGKSVFFTRYNAFFMQWISPKVKILATPKGSYVCHYESSKVTDFIIQNGKIYCSFDFTITIINTL